VDSGEQEILEEMLATETVEVLGVTGLPLSGKTTFAEIAEDHGFERFRMGNALLAEMEKRGIDVTNRSVREFATDMREKEGNEAIADLCVPHIQEKIENGRKVVIDGIRSPEEIERFRDAFGTDILFNCIHSSRQKRFERSKKRERKDDDLETIDDLKWRDEKELSWGLDEAMDRADFLIRNEGSLQSFKDDANYLLDRLS